MSAGLSLAMLLTHFRVSPPAILVGIFLVFALEFSYRMNEEKKRNITLSQNPKKEQGTMSALAISASMIMAAIQSDMFRVLLTRQFTSHPIHFVSFFTPKITHTHPHIIYAFSFFLRGKIQHAALSNPFALAFNFILGKICCYFWLPRKILP